MFPQDRQRPETYPPFTTTSTPDAIAMNSTDAAKPAPPQCHLHPKDVADGGAVVSLDTLPLFCSVLYQLLYSVLFCSVSCTEQNRTSTVELLLRARVRGWLGVAVDGGRVNVQRLCNEDTPFLTVSCSGRDILSSQQLFWCHLCGCGCSVVWCVVN